MKLLEKPSLRREDALVAVLLVALGVLGRLIPHQPNGTPLGSIAIFAGFYFARPWVAAVAVVLSLWLPDLWLGTYEPAIAACVLVGFITPIYLGRRLRSKNSAIGVIMMLLLVPYSFMP